MRQLNFQPFPTKGVTLRESPVIVGSIGFWQLQKEHYRAEIGYALLPH